MTNCGCFDYAFPEDDPEPEESDRRLVIEIPVGYQAIVQIVPVELSNG